MKTRMFIILVLAISNMLLFAQEPQAFKYQAVIRDTSGNIMSNKLISLRISIVKGDIIGEEVYREIHDVWTDKLGLVNLNIGQGVEVSREFSEIPWGEGLFFIRLEIDLDGAMNYQYLGASQLLSVPYALYAGSSGDVTWEKGENEIHYTGGRVGIGTDDPSNTLDVKGGTTLRANTTLGSGNWIGLYFNGYGNDDQPEWLFASHNDGGGFQFRRWDGVDFSEHYLKVDEGRFRFGAYDSPPLFYHFNGWAQITDSLKVGSNSFFVGANGRVGIATTNPESTLDVHGRNIELADFVYLGRMYSGTDLLLGHNIKAIDYENTRGAYVANNWPLGYSGIRMYNGTIQFHAKGGYVYEGELASNELMRIVSNGNVGIGTIDPQRNLHINDVMRLEPRYYPPEDPSEGDIYMDGNDHVLKVYDGIEWKSCW